MALAGFLVTHLLAALLLALTAYVLGRLVLARLAFDSSLERIACAATAGLGVLSLILFTVGMAGWLNRPVLLVILLGIWLSSFPVWAGWIRIGAWKRPPKQILLWILGIAVGAAILAPVWLLAFYPPREWDDISYHLAIAMDYVQQGGLRVEPYLRFPVFPQAMDMLFVPPLMFFDDITAQLMSLLTFLLAALVLFVWGRRDGSTTAGVLAASLWLASPGVICNATTAHIDTGLTLFVLCGAYALFRWIEGRKSGWLILSAFLAGMAAGAKYPGLFFVAFFALVIAVVARHPRRWRGLAIFLAVALVTASPWYIRNLVVTGDPLFPMLLPWVGYSYWNAADLALQRADLSSYGLGHGFLDFVAVWWNVGWNQGLYRAESLVSVALVIPVPLLLLLRWRSRRARILLSGTIVFLVFWFLHAQVMRYLFPVLPFLCLEIGGFLDASLRRLIPERARKGRAWAAAALVALLLIPGIEYGRGALRALGPIPIAADGRHAFLSKLLPDYPAYRLLNERHGSDYALYALRGGRMAYFCEGEWMGDLFGPARTSRIESRLGDGQSLYDELLELGADHFLVSCQAGDVELPDDEAFRRHFRPLYSNGDVRLFELVGETGS